MHSYPSFTDFGQNKIFPHFLKYFSYCIIKNNIIYTLEFRKYFTTINLIKYELGTNKRCDKMYLHI